MLHGYRQVTHAVGITGAPPLEECATWHEGQDSYDASGDSEASNDSPSGIPEEERQSEGEDDTEARAGAGRPGEHFTTRWERMQVDRQKDNKENKRDPATSPQQKEWEDTRRLRSSAGTSLRGSCSNDVCASVRMFNPGHTADASLVAGSPVGLSPLMNR